MKTVHDSRAVACALGLVLAFASAAPAEIVHLSTGATLSVRAYDEASDRIVLHLRSGGSIVCDRGLISRITADEVPHPPPAGDEAPGGPSPERGPTPFAGLVGRAAERHGLDARLLDAVIRVESNYEHRARSPKGAMGLMQLMPATARQYAVTDPYDPALNIEAGARHLRSLLDRFELRLALAAYNAGAGAMERHGGIPPFPETRAYVARVLALLRAPAIVLTSR